MQLRTMLEKLTGKRFDPALPGVVLQNPNRWEPFITIETEYVRVGLSDKSTKQVSEKVFREPNVALMDRSEVEKLLRRWMSRFLESSGIEVDKNLSASIRTEIADSMEIAGVSEDETLLELEGVVVEQDMAGGEILYVVIYSETEEFKIPITGHLHNMGQTGRVRREEFESHVESCLSEYGLSDDDMKRAVKECVREMRVRKIITR